MEVSVALLLELGVIFTALTILGSAARRFGLSPIPLYLLAGLALGNGGIAPVPAAGEFVSTGASIGVVLLLLTLGLEFSIAEFSSSMRRHLPSAGVDLVLNATPGAVVGWLLGLDAVGILAMAGITFISSSGVIARLLNDLRRLGRGAVVDDGGGGRSRRRVRRLLPMLPVALALAAVTAVTKVVTGAYAARRDGVARPGQIRAGTALIARGEFSLVIIGLAGSTVAAIAPVATPYVFVLATVGPLLTRFTK